MEGRVGIGGDGATQVAETNRQGVRNEGRADNMRSAPRALGFMKCI